MDMLSYEKLFRYKFLWNFYLTSALLLTTVQLLHCLPRSSITEAPNYPRYALEDNRSHRSFSPQNPSPFTSSLNYDPAPSATQQRPSNYIQNPYLYQNVIPIKQKVQHDPRAGKSGPQKFLSNLEEPLNEKDRKLLEEEEELEEPDRLSLLLPNSKFDCNSKNTGYYADEELGCEVFHYCQDNAKHSWICPEGFTFHQVHLICMPPGGDNICEKSSKFHFVNEYLYKPINLEEYQQKPNVSLRYSDRFYPDHYYDERENNEQESRPVQHRNSVRVQQDAEQPVHKATFRPETNLGQVFRSQNDVNIPLQQRRPQYLTQQFFNNK